MYVVQHICLYIHDPRESHFRTLKQILRYIRGTTAYAFQLYSPPNRFLISYSDALEWLSNDSSIYIGLVCLFSHNPLSWSSKH